MKPKKQRTFDLRGIALGVAERPPKSEECPRESKAEVRQAVSGKGLLERIVDEIREHDRLHPEHGIGCACHDKHAGALRRLLRQRGMNWKNWSNLNTVLCYVQRNPPKLNTAE